MQTPREQRAAARDQRNLLQLPTHGLGRADIIRSRSPSPAPAAQQNFNFPPQQAVPEEDQFVDAVNMATPEQLNEIREQLRDEVRREIRNETTAAAAAIPDAIKRKPEIPAFNKDHIEIWIKRTEHAYTRAGITAVNDKFAWLETKFPVGTDPKVDEFLYGDATEDNWTAFLAYLRKEHGTTKQQRAAIFLDGFKRDGRRPSQYAAALVDKTKDVNIDDIRKEMLLREMPVDIRRMLQERIEDCTFDEAAKAADAYFDKEGRPRHNAQTSVNEITKPEFSMPFSDDDTVNAVRRFPNSRAFGQNQNRNFPPKGGNASGNFPPKGGNASGIPANSANQNRNICFYHKKYNERAKKCEVTCKFYDEKRFAGNASAGRK